MQSPVSLPWRSLVFIAPLAAVVAGAAWVTRDERAFPMPGSKAPSFTATTLAGDTVTLKDYRDQVVLVNIWATWCDPCREEMPSMQRLYEDLTSKSELFTILAVSIDAPVGLRDAGGNLGGDLKAFADELGLTFPILHDPSGEIQRIYYTTGVPESFVVDRDGIIRSRVAGATEWDAPQRRAAIAALLPDGALADSIYLVGSTARRDRCRRPCADEAGGSRLRPRSWHRRLVEPTTEGALVTDRWRSPVAAFRPGIIGVAGRDGILAA